jgi:hypothetical protein
VLHSAFNDTSFRPKFSGHETFSLRFNWLPKILGPAPMDDADLAGVTLPLEIAMMRYGVGKNMVYSMCHWAELAGIAQVDQLTLQFKPTALGTFIAQHDPYLESLGTIWALHWQVVTNPQLATTWYWMFNGYPKSVFDVRSAIESLQAVVSTHAWRIPSLNTIERDFDCFIRCYTVSRAKKGGLSEDSLECPFAELELIQPTHERGLYEFQRGPKPTLPNNVFAYCLAKFWSSINSETLSLEHVAHAPGSPGRVFQMDEFSIAERLEKIEVISRGHFRWIDSSGLRQIQRIRISKNPISFLSNDTNSDGIEK